MNLYSAGALLVVASLLSAQTNKNIDRFDVQQIDGSIHIVRSAGGKYASYDEMPEKVRTARAKGTTSAGQTAHTSAMVTFVVSDASDTEDPDLTDGVYSPPTLRSAIQNANNLGGTHAISFSPGITVIQPATQLPSVNVNLTIDGTVTAGKVILDGSLSSGTYGLTLGKPSTVKNMVFKSWKNVGLGLGFGSDNSLVHRCDFMLNKIGLNINGHNVTVGGNDTANGNNSYNNTQDGIAIVFANDNIIQNNFCGTKDGVTASPNTSAGLYVLGERNKVMLNVFSGNDDTGLEIGEFSVNTLVDNNFIGMDALGIGRLPNKGDGITTFGDKDSIVNNIISGNAYGITVLGQASQTYIGHNTVGSNISFDSLIGNRYGGLQILGSGVVVDNNVVSNNKGYGILLTGLGGATVKRNYIGTNEYGTSDWGNTGSGVYVSSNNNIIGGPVPADINIISGNGGSGIEMYGGITFSFPGPSYPNYVRGNTIRNNYIGTNANGTVKIPNAEGITMWGYVDSNFVYSNLISGNDHNGVWFRPANGVPTRNIYINNYIGTSISGKVPLANADRGVFIQNGSENMIGGSDVSNWNIISGNGGPGVQIDDGWKNTVINNYIGTTVDGTASLPNNGDGVLIRRASNENVIQWNLISGNIAYGVVVQSSSGKTPVGNVIIGNAIGVNDAVTQALPNLLSGILIENARNTRVGGTGFDSANIVSGNIDYGIYIYGDTSRGNMVRGNYIGTNSAGDAALPNGAGILVSYSNGNVIGGTDQWSGNLISGNNYEGLYLYGADSNKVFNNVIGLNLAQTAVLPNGASGIVLDSSDHNIIGDVAGTENVISGNKLSGIAVAGLSEWNKIYSNYIGTDFTRTKKFGNEVDGIQIADGASRTWIGKTGGGNSIWYNKYSGVLVADSNKNKISQNSFHGNGSIGIDLEGQFTGLSPNDKLDADAGGNDLQNFPELFFADGPFPLRVVGTMESKPNESYTIEFFSTDVKDSTGYGEGKTFLTAQTVGTDSTGFGYFNFVIPTSVSSGMFITATATDFNGSTSEFSKCVEVKATDVYADIAVSVEATADTVKKGDTVAYHITLINNGPDSATQVILRDTLSGRLTYLTDSTSKGNSLFSNGIFTVNIAALEPGETVDIVLVAKADSSGLIVHKVYGVAMQTDFDSLNNTGIDSVTVPALLFSGGEGAAIPNVYQLYQNYPNPFNPVTTIRFDLPVSGFVSLTIYDLLGREVATLVNEEREAGLHAVHFDGSKFSSGAYIYKIQSGNFTAAKKLLLMK